MLKMLIATGLVAAVVGANVPIPAAWHPPATSTARELQLHHSEWITKSDKRVIRKPHLDVWVKEFGTAHVVCIMGPCRAGRRAGDLSD